MSAGFEAFSSRGALVIDGTYRNLCLRYRRSYAAGSIPYHAPPYARLEVNIPVGLLNTPMFFIKTSPGDRVLLQPMYAYNGSYWLEFAVWSNQLPTGPFELIIFDDYLPPSLAYGLEVFNAAGQKVFNTGWPIMKIERVGIIPEGLPGLNSNSVFTFDGFSDSANIAVGLTANRTYYHGANTGDGYSLAPAGRKVADRIDFAQVCFGSESDTFPGGGSVAFSGYLGSGPTTVIFVDMNGLPPAPFG